MRRDGIGSTLLSIVLAATMAVGLCPTPAVASPPGAGAQEGLQPQDDPVSYLDANGEEKSCDTYTIVQSSGDPVVWAGGWYVVPSGSNVVLTEDITLNSDAHLILCDNSTISIAHGVTGDSYSIAIYAQSTGENVGKLLLGNGREGQWGLSSAGVTINGGEITATAGRDASAIEARNLVVNGGSVKTNCFTGAHAGLAIVDYHSEPTTFIVNGGSITSGDDSQLAPNGIWVMGGGAEVNGGIINVRGTTAGINSSGGATINGGSVIASGTSSDSNGIDVGGSSVAINGGSVTASGGTKAINCGTLTLDEDMGVLAGDDEGDATYVDPATWERDDAWARIAAVHHHDGKYFSEWTSENSLPTLTGDYYLANDVTLTSTWEIPADVDISLCLNSKTIEILGEDTHIACGDILGEDARSLTLYDCEDSGTITCDEEANRGRPLVTVGENCTFTMNAGEITGSSAGAVGVYDGGMFKLQGGTIQGNSSKWGAGVWVDQNAVLDMSGGTITMNTDTESFGGGVYVLGGDPDVPAGALWVSGDAQITGNYWSDGDDSRESNVYLEMGTDNEGAHLASGDAKISLANALSGHAGFGVEMQAPGVFTSGWTAHMDGEDFDDYFKSDNPNYYVATEGEELTLATDPVAVTGIELDRYEVALGAGDTTQLVATVKPDDATNKSVTWKSSDESVAKVVNGEVTGVGAGAATITVTSVANPDVSATCKVTVSGEPGPEPVGRHDMYRLYNPYSGEHFYTASAYERDVLVGLGWHDEGVGWIAPDTSGIPVFRLYNSYAGDHHYTVSAFERDHLVELGWTDEGVGWYSAGENGVPIYRQYNPYARTGAHNYTTSEHEAMALVELGWLYEGIGWYGL